MSLQSLLYSLTRSAFSSFPDTSLFTEGSIQFSFKIRHVPPDPQSLAYPEPPSPMAGAEQLPPARRARSRDSTVSEGGMQRMPSDEPERDRAAEYRKWDERGREWMYGFVWFQQRRDRGNARGYMQVSGAVFKIPPLTAEICCCPHTSPIPCAMECCAVTSRAGILCPRVQRARGCVSWHRGVA